MSNEIILPQGDDATITASIDDATGADLDLTGATVTFNVYDGTTLKLTKTATILVEATGSISVDIDAADTASLSGEFLYKITVTDGSSNISTVRVAAFLVPTNQNIADKERIRILLGDTDSTDELLTDQQLYFFVFQDTNLYAAASKAARAIQSKLARRVDTKVEGISKNYSQQAKQYAELAEDLQRRATTDDIPTPGIAGISDDAISDKRAETDRVREKFYMDKFNNPNQNDRDDLYSNE